MAMADMGFTGRIGDLIYYKRGDKTFVRKTPRKFKQTKATRARASEFGRASGIGRAIRHQLSAVITNPDDRKMHGRLVSAVFKWLRSINGETPGKINQLHAIDMFEFSEQGRGVLSRWNPILQVSIPSRGLIQIR